MALLFGDGADKAFEHLKMIRQEVENQHIPHDPSTAEWVTVSAGGVTIIPRMEHSYASYLKIADTMLYDAKKFGRNMAVWANEKMEQWRER